jgi:outer membrane protein assembly factor BamB
MLGLLAISLLLARPGDSEDPPWNRFRGPDGTGVAAPGARLPATLDPEHNRLWRIAVPPGHSSPCLWDQRLFLTGHEGHTLVTLCVNRTDGTLLWRREVTVEALERTHEVNGPASPTPTCDGETVVVTFGSFGLLAYDLDGEERWRRERKVPRNTFGTASSPIIADGTLFVVSDSNEESSLEALDPRTGDLLWVRPRTGIVSGWSTPVPWTNGERRELLVYGAFTLDAYDLATGEPLWRVPGLADEPIVTPVTDHGLVFVTSYNMRLNGEVLGLPAFEEILERYDHDGDGSIDAEEAAENDSVLSRPDADGEGDHPLRMFVRFLDEDRDGEITATEWKKLEAWVGSFEHADGLLAIRPGDAETPATIAWQHARGTPECPSPLIHDGRLYLVRNGGLVTCLDSASGEEVYSERLAGGGPYYASPVAGDDKLYLASARGEVTVLAIGDEPRVLSSLDLDERLMATPALGARAVYLRTETSLQAFGTAD